MKKGFTLIELLVVISIIGILAAMVTASFTSSQRQARDVSRKSDLSQYRTSLEAYANQYSGLYPVFSSRIDPSTNLCVPLGLGTNCPEDPKNKSDDNYYYSYMTDASGTQYVLWSKLENVSSTTYWIVCSTGKSGQANSNPSSGVCPI